MERGLHAPESDGDAHGRFDEVRQRPTGPEHGFGFSVQLWLDADLGYGGRLHEIRLSRLSYAGDGRRLDPAST